MQLLQKTFQLRTCENSVFENRSRPCLLHQIKRCSGSCVGLISPENYAEEVRNTALFLNGKQQEVSLRLQERMEKAAEALAFEQAAMYRDQIQSLRRVQEKQVISSNRLEDVDVLVAVQDTQGHLCVNLAMVRAGQHLGDRPLFPARPPKRYRKKPSVPLSCNTMQFTLSLAGFWCTPTYPKRRKSEVG